jgi:dynein intermediate chain
MKTHLETKGHSHPIYSMEAYGGKNSSGMITVSNDGRICLWSLEMMK